MFREWNPLSWDWVRDNRVAAFAIAAFYLAAGAIWITLSDRALHSLVGDPERLTRYQSYKGWIFVLVTALVLFWVARSVFWLRRRLHREMRQTERFVSTLFSNLPGMVYRCRNDRDWTMEFVSEGAHELTGYTPEELTDDRPPSFADLVHPEDGERVRRKVQEGVGGGSPFQIEYRLRTKDGGEKWVWEQGTAVSPDGTPGALEGFITDISVRKAAERETRQQLGRLRALREIDRAITGTLDLRIAIEVVLKSVVTRLEVDAAHLLLLDEHAQRLSSFASLGFRSEALQHTYLSVGHGLAGRAAHLRETVHVPDLATERGHLPDSVLNEEAFVSYWAVPLLAKGDVQGVLEVFHRQRLDPDPGWRNFLETLGGQAAIAIDSARMFEALRKRNVDLRMAYDETIEGWSRALDLRDQETEGHTRRVAEVTVRLAKAMGLDDREIVQVHRGALLHDIGKMGVPDSILLKPGPLTDEEWEIMRLHPGYAHDLLSPISHLRQALDIPYCHHERWDGSGYPRGLEGREIPLSARIFAVVDVWDALRSDRPYRDGWPESRVRQYLRERSGKDFDPEVVDAFLSLPAGATETEKAGRRGPGAVVEMVPAMGGDAAAQT